MTIQDPGHSKEITLDGVGLSYTRDKTTLQAVASVSCDVGAGEFISLVGPSGCGKSSLLRLILGLVSPTHGRISIGGSSVTGPRRDVGMVFQSPVLLPWLTIEQNVMLPADVMGLDRKLARGRAADLLAQVGLKGFERSYPYELSGGMQQRAGIARALLQDPDVLLMDEPFAALDALTREQMSFELQRIWLSQRKTVVFVTHGISEAVLLSSKIAVMSARPSKILAVLENPLPRPRTLESMRESKFVELTLTIRRLLGATSDEFH